MEVQFKISCRLDQRESLGMHNVFLFCEQAERQVEEYKGMKKFILGWTEKAEALVTGNIVWSSASHLQEQIRAHQVSFNEPQR